MNLILSFHILYCGGGLRLVFLFLNIIESNQYIFFDFKAFLSNLQIAGWYIQVRVKRQSLVVFNCSICQFPMPYIGILLLSNYIEGAT